MKKGQRSVFGGGIVLALILGVLSFVLPSFVARDYDRKSLDGLKTRARDVREEFAAVLSSHEKIRSRLPRAPTADADRSRAFAYLRSLGLREETEGVSLYSPEGKLSVWIGNALDLEDHIQPKGLAFFARGGAPFIIRDKASVHLVSVERSADGGYLVLFQLLAFTPQLQSPYLRDFSFLGPGLRARCAVDYWNFSEDISGFEKIFSRHRDEFAGQPRQKNEIQTLYFPLRGPDGRILATVTLSSPSLTETTTSLREDVLFGFYILLLIALLCLLVSFLSSPGFFRGRSPLAGLGIALTAATIRLIFFPFSRLDRIQSLSVFSPAGGGFFSAGDLTRSPADIFLTSLAIALVAACLVVIAGPLCRTRPKKNPAGAGILSGTAALAAVFVLLFVFQEIVSRLVFNSDAALLRFTPTLSFFLLHLSLLLLLGVFFALSILILRAAARWSSGPVFPLAALVPGFAVFLLLSHGHDSPVFTAVRAASLALMILLAHAPGKMKRPEILFLGFVAGMLLLTQTIDRSSGFRTRSLIANFLTNTVLSQEQWGYFIIEESIPEIDKSEASLVSFLREPGSPDFAHSIWDRTLAAKFNWYSSLEILDPEGNPLSRFSMNIPSLYSRDLSFPISRTWAVSRQTIVSLGVEKDFMVGYRDWFSDDTYLGRTLLFLSLDPDMLPFLYSANPYFELLRTGPMPSMNSVDFGMAVYDPSGRLVFNPRKISSGLPREVSERLRAPGDSVWARFRDKARAYDGFYFSHGGKIFALFTPRTGLRGHTVEFLKLLFLDLTMILIVALPAVIIHRRRTFKNVFWSFSNRVYASFFAVALIPLFLFTFFTRNLFDRIFTERFTEEAATHAGFARSILEDFSDIQGGSGVPSPPEELVLWVSAALSNDINLYRDAKLVSSSRREFFDSGLLPGLIDGVIYHRLIHENVPYVSHRNKIGGYSFQTLTVPYDLGGSQFLISMPFPFEKQDAARATGELVEVLFFLSLFFTILIFLFARGIRAMIVVPVRKLISGTREVSLGNLEVRVEHLSRDEMKTLIDGFNAMVQSLKSHQQELAEMSQKVAWAEMARKVAHEIKNPLTPIQLSAEHILKVFEDRRGDFEKTLRESISYIIGEVENLRRISQEFMEIARDTTLRKENCDLRKILEETFEPYRRLLSSRIRFEEAFEGEDFVYRGDPGKLRTAFRNVIANAVEAIRDGGRISLRLKAGGGRMTIVVEDSGPGMSPEVMCRIFEPYYSTKPSGTGLGLPITKKIIEDHGGSVQAESVPGKGTIVTIILPCVPLDLSPGL